MIVFDRHVTYWIQSTSVQVITARLSNYFGMTKKSYYTVLLMLKSGKLIANRIREFCYYSYDYFQNQGSW